MLRNLSSYFLALLLLAAAGPARSQGNTIFLSHGRIEYMRSVNVFAQISKEEEDDQWAELRKKMSSHFQTAYFDLYLTRNKCLYKPGRATEDKQSASNWWTPPPHAVIVWPHLQTSKPL